jgi:hypothetical protein
MEPRDSLTREGLLLNAGKAGSIYKQTNAGSASAIPSLGNVHGEQSRPGYYLRQAMRLFEFVVHLRVS